jgi:hypothetical protein
VSRSRRKTPIAGITSARSDKPFKVDEHRAERRTTRAVVRKTLDGDDTALYSRPHGNPWLAPKDGKQLIDPKSKLMRK